jgi:endonuclease YncB( thermonuclease family)
VNTTNQTVSTRGLRFIAGTKKGTVLGEEIFAARERRRYIVSLLGISLGNTDTGIELQTGAGESLSQLHWGKAKEGVIYRYGSLGVSHTAKVLRIIDGDTFEAMVDGEDPHKEDVRLLGVDAPETVHPTKGIQPLGKEAKNYVTALIENKKIELQFDTDERDLYGRILAYVTVLPSNQSVQEMMIREGLVKVDEQHLYTKKDQYIEMQNEAKSRGVGLWEKVSKKKSSSSSSKSSKSSKKISSITSVQTVASKDPYESKPTYQNVFSSQVSSVEEDSNAQSSSDDELYASLLEDQPQIVESCTQPTPPEELAQKRRVMNLKATIRQFAADLQEATHTTHHHCSIGHSSPLLQKKLETKKHFDTSAYSHRDLLRRQSAQT